MVQLDSFERTVRANRFTKVNRSSQRRQNSLTRSSHWRKTSWRIESACGIVPHLGHVIVKDTVVVHNYTYMCFRQQTTPSCDAQISNPPPSDWSRLNASCNRQPSIIVSNSFLMTPTHTTPSDNKQEES